MIEGFSITEVDATDKEREVFRDWFTGLIMNFEANRSCFWRNVLRANRRNMFITYLSSIREYEKEVEGDRENV